MTANIVIRPNVIIRPNTVVKGFAGPTLLLDADNYNSGTGIWNDTSGHGYNATGYGTTFSNGVVNFTGGSYAAVAPGVYFGTHFTIEGWVKLTSYASWSRLIDFGNGPNVPENVFLAVTNGAGGYPTFTTYGEDSVTSDTQMPVGQWAHLVATYDGTTGKIYINGSQVASGTMTAPMQVSRSDCYIGRSNWHDLGDLDLEGAIGYVAIHPLTMDSGTVSSRYSAGRTRFPITASYTVAQDFNNAALVVTLSDYPDAGTIPVGATCTINSINTTLSSTYVSSDLSGYPQQIMQFSDDVGTITAGTQVVFTWTLSVTIITNVSISTNPSPTVTVDFVSTVSTTTTGTIFFAWGYGDSGPYSITINPGSNTYTSPGISSLNSSGNDFITQITIPSGPDAGTSNIFTSAWNVICLVEGTMITMADGSYKAVEDVRYDDLIRVWNFDLGEFSEALPVFVKREEIHHEHNRFTFSDGTVLRTVGHHVFNKQAGAFTMLVRDTTPVGTITFNEQGEEVTLISKETIQEPVKFYNVWTQYHLNLFADGILTSNRFNNIYPIQNMKFVKDSRALRPLEEFANIDPKYISGLRLQEQPKQYTAEYIKDYIDNKLERLNIDQLGDIKV